MSSPPVLLLVDSDDGARRAAAALLRECGHAVIEAHNGLEGLRLARTHVPAVVILDPWPFVAAAAQMVERMRREPATTASAVLLLTTAAPERLRARPPFDGIRSTLPKPLSPSELLDAVSRLLGGPGAAGPGEVPQPGAGV